MKKKKTRTARRNRLATAIPEGAGGLKLPEAAHYLSLSSITLRRLVIKGFLHPNRVTRHLIFSKKDLDAFLAAGRAE